MPLIACQRDAQLRTLDAEVLACNPDGDHWQVRLDDTILYPEGGGQPADHGRIGSAQVVDVQADAGVAWHRTTTPIALGPAQVQVDWARRFDHMQQHSAQHLLTALAHTHFGWATTSFHLHQRDGDKVPLCDIEVDAGAVGSTELATLETLVNNAIRAHIPITHREVQADQIEALGVRTRGLPSSVQRVRLVEIEGIDLNTCGGTHVANTAQLQTLVLAGTERIRGGIRLFYASGGRVADGYKQMVTRAQGITALLSQSPEAHVDAIERLMHSQKRTRKAVTALQTELATSIGVGLNAQGGDVVSWHRADAEPPFLNAVASNAQVHDGRLWLFTCGANEDGSLLLLGPPDVLAAAKGPLLQLLQARGGGPPGRLQGRAQRIDHRNEAVVLLRRIAAEVAAS
jgi:Ser-tRNA(Ala) deacylase AlaX